MVLIIVQKFPEFSKEEKHTEDFKKSPNAGIIAKWKFLCNHSVQTNQDLEPMP